MERRLFGLFTGTHLTVMTAVLAPTALYGTVTYSNVALVNPTTGVAVSVDAAGRLTAVNPYSLYRDYPANQIDLDISNNGAGCEASQQWAVPAGKAFIVTAISGYAALSDVSFTSAGFQLWDKAGCVGHILTTFMASTPSSAKFAPVTAQYGVGIPVAAGSTISLYSSSNYGYTHIHGYLVPAAWVRPGQVFFPSAPDVAAKRAALH